MIWPITKPIGLQHHTQWCYFSVDCSYVAGVWQPQLTIGSIDYMNTLCLLVMVLQHLLHEKNCDVTGIQLHP